MKLLLMMMCVPLGLLLADCPHDKFMGKHNCDWCDTEAEALAFSLERRQNKTDPVFKKWISNTNTVFKVCTTSSSPHYVRIL